MKQAVILFLFFIGCQSPQPDKKHIFYLHGRIIELQGINAVSEEFGEYKYQEIIDSLEYTGAEIHKEIRTEETNFDDFSKKVSLQIDSLISKGVAPKDITIIGASKGAVIAMNISDMNENPINYILLGANNDYIEREKSGWNLHGNVLGIYEKSDSLAGKNYQYWIDKSSRATRFEQLEINTGLGHGFLYSPLKEWLDPAKRWIKN